MGRTDAYQRPGSLLPSAHPYESRKAQETGAGGRPVCGLLEDDVLEAEWQRGATSHELYPGGIFSRESALGTSLKELHDISLHLPNPYCLEYVLLWVVVPRTISPTIFSKLPVRPDSLPRF